MKKINLIIGLHNHQPVGNFDFVFDQAYSQAYDAFFQCQERHPNIKVVQHYTGILLQWLVKHKPDFVDRINRRLASGNMELLSGGFYEPILSSIPDHDKIAQIQKLNGFINEKFNYQPKGMWLAERVWEPTLPEFIAGAGLNYTIIDDSHFKYAGLEPQQLHGYYVTEHNGCAVNIFPISEEMRYLVPFKPPVKTIDYLYSLASEEGDKLVVFADDGEKFGVWPDTYKKCYTDGWLDEFFTLLEENSDWINIITFQEALEQLKPSGRIYLPTASYREMMQWALPAHNQTEYEKFVDFLDSIQLEEKHKTFVRAGFWRNFLAKYDESNNMHKRMLQTSRKIAQNPNEAAHDHLMAGQCNCAYWHGVFGGLYLPHLRSAIYEQLIQADNVLDHVDQAKTDKGWKHTQVTDFDADGANEVIVDTDRFRLYISPQNGGSLFEHDVKPKAFNIVNPMTRRAEAYHKKLLLMQNQKYKTTATDAAGIQDEIVAKQDDLENYLHYDWYRRASFVDHFLNSDTTLDSFSKALYGEQGDFVNQPYEFTTENDLTLIRHGNVWIHDEFLPVSVEKQFVVKAKSDQLQVNYTLKNCSNRNLDLWFAVENVFSLLAGNALDRYYAIDGKKLDACHLASSGEIPNASHLQMSDDWMGLTIALSLSQPASMWRFPIETVSISEAGFEKIYQASVVMPNWKISLEPAMKWKVTIKQDFIVKG